MHEQAKLRNWGLTILLAAPYFDISTTLQVRRKLRLRHPPALKHIYVWEHTSSGQVPGVMVESTSDLQSSILLEQESNGLYWRLATSNEELSRQRKSAQRFDEAIVREASFFKRIHGFPWSVMDFVANTDVLSALKKQPFRWYKGVDNGLHTIVERLIHAAQASAWQAAALQQTQANIWAHHNKLTEYQVWVIYRGSTRQLNR